VSIKIQSFRVLPKLPEKLEKLREMSNNLYWTWNLQVVELYRRLDRDLWEFVNHNPVLMFGMINQHRLETMANDEGFLAQLDRIYEEFQKYLTGNRWFQKTHKKVDDLVVAYFSMEYGITECLPIYSGGLGILAGDHLKSSSDLGIPLVGVGLLYQEGYFRQYLNIDGWQQESYLTNDFHNLPLTLISNDEGEGLTISVRLANQDVFAQIWRAQVGRIPLYLLDCNIPQNSKENQGITAQLYGGDLELRIKQEILLGIGGVRALHALGIHPSVCHMNEGHSAFLSLERIRQKMEEHKLSFHDAKEATLDGNIFTTHTPVPAGIDIFPAFLMDKYFSEYIPSLKISRSEFFELGRIRNDDKEPFNMAVLALHLSSHHNGVSNIHGSVSRKMWQDAWPQFPESEIPISYITNGIHITTWISRDMKGLLDRYLGPRWSEDPGDRKIWNRVDEIPDEELWRTHLRRRERLVAFTRRRLRDQLENRGASPAEIEKANEVMNSDYLTIGFARRFATYKRATLIFRDLERLRKIINDQEKPVQIIFAGKAHPRDLEGKELIRQIINISQSEEFRRNIVFLEDYGMVISRYLVQGVDVWLNTPRRLMEASGTSGMKVPANGGINCSILDGWWVEAYNLQTGWVIGKDEVYDDIHYQDEVESSALYNLLEKEIVPLFYDRGADRLPRKWIARMKSSMRRICPVFNSNRMVFEYLERSYIPANERWKNLTENNFERSKNLAEWKRNIRNAWKSIRILKTETDVNGDLTVGQKIEIKATVAIPKIQPSDISVQIYYGLVDTKGNIIRGQSQKMAVTGSEHDDVYTFNGVISCTSSGLQGYAIRVLPCHEDLDNPAELSLIKWFDV